MYLENRSGLVCEYRVSEVSVVEFDTGQIACPVRDRAMVTLQTCTYSPLRTSSSSGRAAPYHHAGLTPGEKRFDTIGASACEVLLWS